MAILEDMLKGGNIVTGLAIGVGAAVVGPILIPVFGSILRPVTKAVVKAGMVAYDAAREGAERLNEASGDVVAEARSELNEAGSAASRHRTPAPASAGGEPS
jgi:hypothetical protein